MTSNRPLWLINFISLIYNFMPISYTCAVSNTTLKLASHGQCANLAQEPLGPSVPCYIHNKWKCEVNLAPSAPWCWGGTEQQWWAIVWRFESFFTRDGAIICKACSEISKNFLSLRAVMRIISCWVTIKLPSFQGTSNCSRCKSQLRIWKLYQTFYGFQVYPRWWGNVLMEEI